MRFETMVFNNFEHLDLKNELAILFSPRVSHEVGVLPKRFLMK
jgi:hypothetical protein